MVIHSWSSEHLLIFWDGGLSKLKQPKGNKIFNLTVWPPGLKNKGYRTSCKKSVLSAKEFLTESKYLFINSALLLADGRKFYCSKEGYNQGPTLMNRTQAVWKFLLFWFCFCCGCKLRLFKKSFFLQVVIVRILPTDFIILMMIFGCWIFSDQS